MSSMYAQKVLPALAVKPGPKVTRLPAAYSTYALLDTVTLEFAVTLPVLGTVVTVPEP